MARGLTVLTFRFKVQSKGVLELCCLGLPLSGPHSSFPLPSSTVPAVQVRATLLSRPHGPQRLLSSASCPNACSFQGLQSSR